LNVQIAIAKALFRRKVVVPFGFALGLFFGFLAVRGMDWSAVGGQVTGTSPWAVAAAVALVLLSGYVRALRWRYLFAGHRITATRLFLVEHAALGLNNVSPVRVLDEPAIVAMLTLRDKIPAATVLATIVMTRVQDVAVTLLFASSALVFEPALTGRVRPAAFASIIFIVVLLGLLNLGALARRSPLIARIPGIMSYAEAVSSLMARKLRLGLTGALTATYWMLLGPMAYVLAQSMGVEITLFQATIVALGAIYFATSTPGLPGALGTFELAVVEMVGLWGVPREMGVGYAIVLHLILFLPPIVIAFIVLPREGISFLGRGLATDLRRE
jgi:uncharacterized protein (TIRG00374 family)